jgi:hypothetical protein
MSSSVSAEDMSAEEPAHESFKEEPLEDSRRLERRREVLLGAGSPVCIPILSGLEDSVLDKKEPSDGSPESRREALRRDDALLGGTVCSPVFIVPTPWSVKGGGISFAKKFCSDGCLIVKALLIACVLFGVPVFLATTPKWSIFWPGSV